MCIQSLSDPIKTDDITLKYGEIFELIGPQKSFKDWDTFFNNKYPEECPITNCTLHLAEECEGEPLVSELVTLGIEFPWALYAVTNQSLGYKLSLCIKCTNDYDTLSFAEWNLT